MKMKFKNIYEVYVCRSEIKRMIEDIQKDNICDANDFLEYRRYNVFRVFDAMVDIRLETIELLIGKKNDAFYSILFYHTPEGSGFLDIKPRKENFGKFLSSEEQLSTEIYKRVDEIAKELKRYVQKKYTDAIKVKITYSDES